ncbi:MAG: IPExxxVDY family protein [Chitinophagales bacterium]|nr:IPExxxVDY family protein [Chitinophagales bacterium]MCZ2393992.1 IPExxxVDY family protein [Chitinophagales bacterium]
MSGRSVIKERKLEENEVKIFGIVSNSPIHKLAWLINNKLEWNLERIGDLVIEDDRYKKILFNLNPETPERFTCRFPICSFVNEGDKYDIDLIKNKSDSNIFFQELKNFDYLILIHGVFNYLPIYLLNELKSLPLIQLAAEISIKKIKDQSLLLSYK